MMRQTEVLKIDPTCLAEPLIAQAAEVLRAGGLVAFPTGRSTDWG
jgi:tRNA A37 threonylcarbamoyladenosine synthetase subunit TsaC/SUA5/YrdC